MYDYKPGADYGNELLQNSFITTDKEKLYNKVERKFYYFYKVTSPFKKYKAIPSDGVWIRDKWVMLPEGMCMNAYNKMVSILPGVKINNEFQSFAYLVAAINSSGIGIADSDWNDPIFEKIGNHKMGFDIISDTSGRWRKYDDKFTKAMRNKLYNNQITFDEYFKAVFTHSFDINRYKKYGNEIGIYADPKSSSLYGRIVIFFLTKDENSFNNGYNK
ncbi:hypothetical protein LNP07_04555 [Apilactobacillus sp. M161]|uniref:Uncharacterized protein n=1 Tax=Apilactobacillus xinyiensis TaxID=2841032 RepID=A0ABT0I233_9LACO|nr:hypothetical protein [Apilactobacillus xinyiensis]MCK8624782.1 hypothetical protein [Apilactobacillus xinyiensis]